MTDVDPNLPKVTLGGKEWPVHELVPRQFRKIRRTLLDLNKALGKAKSFLNFAENLSDDQYQALLDIAYWGLTSGKGISFEQFIDTKIADRELFDVFFAVRDQSALFLKTPAGETGGDAGEATAEMSQTPTPTGT